jgi:toxin CcdB
MARFDVHLIEGTDQRVVDIQADILRDLRTRLVVPLGVYSTTQNEAAKRLRPRINFEDLSYVLNTPELAAVPVARLSPAVGSLLSHRDDIIDAIDFLMQGF